MKSEIFALPLLALARGVLSSPCLPPLTSTSLSVSTTASSETVSTASTESSTESSIASEESTTASTESTTVLTTTESTTASFSESTTSATLSSAPVTTAPEPGFYVTIFRPHPGPGVITAPITVTTIAPQGDQPGTVIIETPTQAAPTSDATTSELSTESTAAFTTTESTTTSAEPEPEETNLIINGGFEASTPQPWAIFNTRNTGSLGISTNQPYVGQQSGTYEHSDNIGGEYWGIYQPLDSTRLVVGRYLVTARIRVPDNSCLDLMLAPSVANGGHMALGSSVINVNDAVDNWLEVRAMFHYSRLAFIINDPGVAIVSRCESVSFSVDDVSMVQFIVPTD
ncbi:hypothetical protein CEP54_000105 [Fusarium duplospermum]|uniref:CBM-cenC domain-containing protein n=1 Tax=Fusarium duplospermum TaxID=1325734 RepID=A0A428R8M2_9HYPO|nr:hypothetical protein CEP54_000105 [Fusarium duplospermum]